MAVSTEAVVMWLIVAWLCRGLAVCTLEREVLKVMVLAGCLGVMMAIMAI